LPGGVIPPQFLFTEIPAGLPRTFVTPPGDFSSLVRNADESLTRTLKDGTQTHFDARGLQTAVVDRHGNATVYTYDGSGRLIAITDPKGLVTTLTYAGTRLASITDPAGRTTTFQHGGNGNLSRITDPDGSSRQFGYDARHRMIAQTSKRGFVTTYHYDFAGRNMQANRPDGSTRQIAASEIVGLIDLSSGVGTPTNPAPVVRPEDVTASFIDGNGNPTRFRTDRFGAATEIVDALGRRTMVVRDAH
jgi:YD repeat-containing protein